MYRQDYDPDVLESQYIDVLMRGNMIWWCLQVKYD